MYQELSDKYALVAKGDGVKAFARKVGRGDGAHVLIKTVGKHFLSFKRMTPLDFDSCMRNHTLLNHV